MKANTRLGPIEPNVDAAHGNSHVAAMFLATGPGKVVLHQW